MLLSMTQSRRRFLIAAVGAALGAVAACSRTDSSTKTPHTGDAATPPAAASAGRTSDGTVGLSGSPGTRDTTTDRADRGRIIGAEKAKIWVVMVSDFQCPF